MPLLTITKERFQFNLEQGCLSLFICRMIIIEGCKESPETVKAADLNLQRHFLPTACKNLFFSGHQRSAHAS